HVHRPSIQTIQPSPKEHFPSTVGFTVVFLNIFDDGRTYTEGEHCTWLTALGFAKIERVPLRRREYYDGSQTSLDEACVRRSRHGRTLKRSKTAAVCECLFS